MAEKGAPPPEIGGNGHDKLPIKMLNDRILVHTSSEGERRSTGGIVIPATAQVGKRLAWAEAVAAGPNVRSIEPGDHVLRTGCFKWGTEHGIWGLMRIRERPHGEA